MLFDFSRLDAIPDLSFGIIIRSALMAFGIASIFLIRHLRTLRIIDINAAGFSAFVTVGILLFHFTRDMDLIRIVTVAMLYLYAANLAFPTYTIYPSLPVPGLLTGDGYLLFSSDRPELIEHRFLVTLVVIRSLIIALLSSAILQRGRYQAFTALQKVKILSGLLPICASCKKIRDDQGFYQQIENTSKTIQKRSSRTVFVQSARSRCTENTTNLSTGRKTKHTRSRKLLARRPVSIPRLNVTP